MTLMAAWPLLQVPPWPADFGDTSRARVVQIELEGRWLGTTSTADFVPIEVDSLPTPNEEMVAALWRNETPERLNRATLPDVATVDVEEVSPLHFRYTISSERAFFVRTFLWDFPGWEARLMGR